MEMVSQKGVKDTWSASTPKEKYWYSSTSQSSERNVQSVATYGCESKGAEEKINVFENKCLQKMLKIPYTNHTTDKEIRKICGIEE